MPHHGTESRRKPDALPAPRLVSAPASTLVLSGGGLKAFYTLGALSRLHDEGKLRGITQFAGTSAGAIVCSLLCIGYTPQEILSYALRVGGLVSQKKSGVLALISLVCKVDAIFDDIMAIMDGMYADMGLSTDITFAQLYRYTKGRELMVIATALGGDTFYSEAPFSTRATPNMSVGLAVRMSCAVPPLVTPVLFEGRNYCDGFLTNNFPVRRAIEMWDDGRRVLAVGTDRNRDALDNPRVESHIVPATPEYGSGVFVSTRDRFGMYLYAREKVGRMARAASV